MYDSPDPSKRHMIGWVCENGICIWTNPALSGNTKTPIIDRLERNTSQPAGITKKRKNRDPDEIESLTNLFGRV